jgi:uncharacterized protein (DUF58 family)
MIVPATRLLFWVAVIVAPFAALGGLVPGAVPIAALAVGGLAAWAGADAWRSRRRFEGVAVQLPPLIRLAKDRPGGLAVRLTQTRPRNLKLRLGLALPAEIESPSPDLWTVLAEETRAASLVWPCTGRRRGRYRLGFCHLETPSPWGLWAVRRRQSLDAEIRVYPNLLTERRQVAALFLNRGAFGVHTQRLVGKGREFEKLREYVAGDSYEDIHWKATAKRGRPITKVYQVERTQEVYVVVDTSRLSGRWVSMPLAAAENSPGAVASPGPAELPFPEPTAATAPGTIEVTVLERYLTAALVLGLAAERQGDRFGMVAFGDRVHGFVRAKNGRAHYGICRDTFYALQPQEMSPDFNEVCSFIRLRLRRRALLVFLTALDDPVLAESFVSNVELICRQHLVLVNLLPPGGVRPLFSTPEVGSLDAIYEHLGGHVRWQQLRELQSTLQHRGVRLALLENERLSAQLVSQYLDIKRRQLL